MSQPFTPTYADPARVLDEIRVSGYAALTPEALADSAGVRLADLQALSADWADLPPDNYLRDGGRYRRRRHACFVAVVLVAREGIKGAETRVFEAEGPRGQRFTLLEPWSLLFMDDQRVIHESTPIQPAGESGGHRDTLVLTFRAGAFQGED